MFKNKKLASALLLTTFVAASVATTALAARPSLRRFRAMTDTAALWRFRIRIGRKPRTSRFVISRAERIRAVRMGGPIFSCALRRKNRHKTRAAHSVLQTQAISPVQ